MTIRNGIPEKNDIPINELREFFFIAYITVKFIPIVTEVIGK